MVDRVYYIRLYTLYSDIYIFQLNQYVIAFNYAGSRDNGKLLIGTFPNESDDGESLVYKLIYARTRYFHGTDLSQQYIIVISTSKSSPKNHTVCPFVN